MLLVLSVTAVRRNLGSFSLRRLLSIENTEREAEEGDEDEDQEEVENLEKRGDTSLEI